MESGFYFLTKGSKSFIKKFSKVNVAQYKFKVENVCKQAKADANIHCIGNKLCSSCNNTVASQWKPEQMTQCVCALYSGATAVCIHPKIIIIIKGWALLAGQDKNDNESKT